VRAKQLQGYRLMPLFYLIKTVRDYRFTLFDINGFNGCACFTICGWEVIFDLLDKWVSNMGLDPSP